MGNEASNAANSVLHDVQTNLEAGVDRIQKACAASTGTAGAGAPMVARMPSMSKKVPTENDEWREEPILTDRQVQILKQTWILLDREVHDIGVLTFLHLFDSHPDARKFFKSFSDINGDDLLTNEIFRNHTSRVMGVIEKVVQWLDEPERYKTYLSILGQKHTMYEAEPRFMDQMGLMFITAVKPLLEKENAWDEEVNEAWKQLFVVVVFWMRKSMGE